MSIISQGAGRPLLRGLLLFFLFLAVGFMYWRNFDERLYALLSRNLSDEDGALDKAERYSLLRAMTAFKKQYGLDLKIDIKRSGSPMIKSSGHSVMFSVGVEDADVQITMPLVAQKAVDKARIAALDDAISACLKEKPPAICLFNGIQDLAEALAP